MSEEDLKGKAKELIDFGADLAGSAAGGALGFLALGPEGAAAGALVGTALTKAIQIAGDIADRHLSNREKLRTGAGLAFALDRIGQYIKSGHIPRDDGFFDQNETGRSKNDELLEGVLLKCKSEPEEKKIKLIGNIYANLVFMPEVSPEGANWLLQKAQDLTYRQLCMLAIIQQKEHKGASWGPNDGDPAFEIEYKQIDDLVNRDNSVSAIKLEEKTEETRSIIGLSRAGKLLFDVMSLDEIPEEELRKLTPRFPRAFD
jgi:hypothetical protein